MTPFHPTMIGAVQVDSHTYELRTNKLIKGEMRRKGSNQTTYRVIEQVGFQFTKHSVTRQGWHVVELQTRDTSLAFFVSTIEDAMSICSDTSDVFAQFCKLFTEIATCNYRIYKISTLL